MLRKIGLIKNVKKNRSSSHVPPGQYVTTKFPVLSFGSTPTIDMNQWAFRVFGLVEKEISFDWKQFKGLGTVTLDAGFHCVTQWSRLENLWQGVPVSSLLDQIELKSEARYVMVHCYGGYTTNLELEVLQDDDVLFAYNHDGAPLMLEHGGPLRLVVPKRYGWKSAKWVRGLEFMAMDTPGFWEDRGYHMQGDPMKEQRFA